MNNRGVANIFSAVSRSISYAARNPLITLTTILYYQVKFAQATQQNLTISCPAAYEVTNALQQNMDTENCFSTADFMINSNPLEDLQNEIDFECGSGDPKIQLSGVPQLMVLNTDNMLGLKGYHLSYIACGYNISSSQATITGTNCPAVGNYSDSQCWFPNNDGYFRLFTVLINSTVCAINNSTSQFNCERDLALSPLSGTWQSKTEMYPHIVYNDTDNSIAYAVNPQIHGTDTYCGLQLFGNASAMQDPFATDPGEYDFIININPSKSVLIDQSAACQDFFSYAKGYSYVGFEWHKGFFFLDNNTVAMRDVDSTKEDVRPAVLYRVQGGNNYYQDRNNNTYSIGSTFNVSAAVVVAKQISEKCHLNLTNIVAPPSPHSFFRLKANDSCATELHEMEMNYLSNVTQTILDCTSDMFATITGSNAMSWPTWNCPPNAAHTTPASSSSSSTGHNTASSSSSTGSNQPANDNDNVSIWYTPFPYIGMIIGAAISVLAVGICISKRRQRREMELPLIQEQYQANSVSPTNV
jgi:hypothetical protein